MKNVDEFRKKMTTISTLDAASQELLSEFADYSQAIETKLWLLERRTFGQSSERYVDPSQPTIFNEVEVLVDEANGDPSADPSADENADHGSTDVDGYRRKKRRSQIELPDHLPRQEQVHELADDDRRCSCCNEIMAEMGEDVSERLHVVPAKVMVKKHVFKKYACKNKSCGTGPKQAQRPASSIPKIKATEETLAFIAVQKFIYSVPLYRLEYLFRNEGVELSRYVMSLWMIKLAAALKPIYMTLEEMLLSSNYMHMDETTLQVLQEPGRAATTKSYVWVRTGGVHGQAPPIALYHYSPSRSAKVAVELLGDFRGHLQTDDYAAYGSALSNRDGITHVLCWDHARRYFYEAFVQIAKNKRANTTADRVLKLIAKLYKIEASAKCLSADNRRDLRQKESVPILESISRICTAKRPSLAKGSATAVAIDYMVDNWQQLNLYTDDGNINISNSPAEQRIRPFAVGRKNWLFACTPAGAEASTIIYSVLETAKLNGLDPFTYITFALRGLATAAAAEDLADLLPIKRHLVH